jgi:dTMP kinase
MVSILFYTMHHAHFITFEGGEGCGKTTQSRLLNQSFTASNIKILSTREPGGTENAEKIRQLLLNGTPDKLEKLTEVLLHMAARSEHVAKIIKPALTNSTTVICDRFIDSTIAYQGYGHMLGAEFITSLHQKIFDNFYPDLTIILDMPVEQGLARARKRSTTNDRYEKMELAFHQRVRQGFHEISKLHPKRCAIIDANMSINEIHNHALAIIKQRLKVNLT